MLVFIANILMFLFQISTIRVMAKITQIPKYLLFPIITVFCVVGCISIRNSIFDLVSVLLFLVFGYIFDKNNYPLSPFILAFVLGGIVEDNMRRSIIYYGNFAQCMQQVSIGTLFVILAVVVPAVMFALDTRKKKKEAAN